MLSKISTIHKVKDRTLNLHNPSLEKAMAPHSSVLAWRIPGTEEPDGLLSMGWHRVGHDWSDLAASAAATHHWTQCLSRFLTHLPPLPFFRFAKVFWNKSQTYLIIPPVCFSIHLLKNAFSFLKNFFSLLVEKISYRSKSSECHLIDTIFY